jgi:hypothetical protein
LKTGSADSVSLPISVTDEDGDDIQIFYRFNDDGKWFTSSSEFGSATLPLHFFSRHSTGVNDILEAYAWDGLQQSQNVVRIGYSLSDSGSDSDAEGQKFFDVISPAAFAGMICGAFALIILVVVILVVFKRRRQSQNGSSSSTGLIESE